MNELIFILSGGILGSVIMAFTKDLAVTKRLVLLLEGVAFLVLGELSLQHLLKYASFSQGVLVAFLLFLMTSFLFTTTTREQVKGGE